MSNKAALHQQKGRTANVEVYMEGHRCTEKKLVAQELMLAEFLDRLE